MLKYILNRLVIVVPTLFVITLIAFVFMNLAPGDPINVMINPLETRYQIDHQALELMRERLGLNKPVPVRYVIWLGQVARGNLGYSYITRLSVWDTIRIRLLPTLELAGTALLISTVLGTLFGVIAAIKQYSIYDHLLTFVSLIGLSTPTFFFGLAALFFFTGKLGWMPAYGMQSSTEFEILDNLHHLVMPAAVLSLDLIAGLTRISRTAMLEEMGSDYLRTARAKGLSENVVMVRHAFRNALLPLITVTTLRLPFLFGGAVIVESVFTWPGIGRLAVFATYDRDYPVLMGLGLITATLVLMTNLLADVLYAVVDPRVRIGMGSSR